MILGRELHAIVVKVLDDLYRPRAWSALSIPCSIDVVPDIASHDLDVTVEKRDEVRQAVI
jgi:hypothetical protein